MDNNINDRMAHRRGRPSKEEVAARPVPAELKSGEVITRGLVGPCCGRAMHPKIIRTTEAAVYYRCTLCGAEFRSWREGDRVIAQVIR